MRSDSFPQLQTEPRLADLPKDTLTLDMMLEGSYVIGPRLASLMSRSPIRGTAYSAKGLRY
jgi:hypothetical protein